MKKLSLSLLFSAIAPLMAATHYVGAGGDFVTLPPAVAAAAAGDTLILLSGNTFSLSSTLTLPRAITIEGQNKNNCIITTSTSPSTFSPTVSVTQSNTTLRNFTVVNSSTSGSAATIAASGSLSNLIFDNLILNTGEFAITLLNDNFQITNCAFFSNQTDSHRFINLKGNVGASKISNNTFTELPGGVGRIILADGGIFSGSVEISNNVCLTSISQFFIMTNFTGSFGGFSITFSANSYSDTNGSIIFFSDTPNFLDLFSTIDAHNNIVSDSSGKGLIVLDGTPGSGLKPVSTHPSTIFKIYDNSPLTVTAPDFANAAAEGLIGYNTTLFYPFYITVPPTNLSLQQYEERFPTEGDFVDRLSWQNPDPGNIVAFRILVNSQFSRQTSETTASFHRRKKGVAYTYTVSCIDRFGNESGAVSISSSR